MVPRRYRGSPRCAAYRSRGRAQRDAWPHPLLRGVRKDYLGSDRSDPARAPRAPRKNRLGDQLGAATIFWSCASATASAYVGSTDAAESTTRTTEMTSPSWKTTPTWLYPVDAVPTNSSA